MNQASVDLRAIDALIPDADHWIQHVNSATLAERKCYCLNGALEQITQDSDGTIDERYRRAALLLELAIAPSRLAEFYLASKIQRPSRDLFPASQTCSRGSDQAGGFGDR